MGRISPDPYVWDEFLRKEEKLMDSWAAQRAAEETAEKQKLDQAVALAVAPPSRRSRSGHLSRVGSAPSLAAPSVQSRRLGSTRSGLSRTGSNLGSLGKSAAGAQPQQTLEIYEASPWAACCGPTPVKSEYQMTYSAVAGLRTEGRRKGGGASATASSTWASGWGAPRSPSAPMAPVSLGAPYMDLLSADGRSSTLIRPRRGQGTSLMELGRVSQTVHF
mmetsp:Transcript_85029/g.188864  ORF Transcript_85029/g.188864 Transcript_85029/m.188864 type:complete len:219 (-) Transcript_85029:87-743(-)